MWAKIVGGCSRVFPRGKWIVLSETIANVGDYSEGVYTSRTIDRRSSSIHGRVIGLK